jgi:hypothetical protein
VRKSIRFACYFVGKSQNWGIGRNAKICPHRWGTYESVSRTKPFGGRRRLERSLCSAHSVIQNYRHAVFSRLMLLVFCSVRLRRGNLCTHRCRKGGKP